MVTMVNSRSSDQAIRVGSKRYVPELDGLRAIAIGMVMLYHCWRYSGPDAVGRAISSFTSTGWAGVDVFFVVSGFLITGILLDSRNKPHPWRTFYARRSLRIFPLYYLVTTVLLISALVVIYFDLPVRDANIDNIDGIWWNYLYLTNFGRAFYGVDAVPFDISWSLAVEEQYYLVYPFIVHAVSQRRLKHILVGSVVGAALCRWGSFVVFDGEWIPAYVLPFCRMDQLALGGLACLAIREQNESTLRWIRRFSLPLVVAAALVLALFGRGDIEFIRFG